MEETYLLALRSSRQPTYTELSKEEGQYGDGSKQSIHIIQERRAVSPRPLSPQRQFLHMVKVVFGEEDMLLVVDAWKR